MRNCCNGKLYTCNGYIWVYEKDYSTFDLENILKNKHQKSVVQLDFDKQLIKIWDSIQEASNDLNIFATSISKVCQHKMSHAGGFIWEYYLNYKNNIINPMQPRPKHGKIIRMDLDGNYLDEWESVSDVLKKLFNKKDNGSITWCCENTRKTAYGYKWMYEEDYLNKIKGSNFNG